MSAEDIADGIKLIKHNAGRVDEPDDPSLPYKLEINCRPPEFLTVTFVSLYGGSEELVVRGETLEAINTFVEQHRFRSHPRLRRFVVTGPDGVVEEFRGRSLPATKECSDDQT